MADLITNPQFLYLLLFALIVLFFGVFFYFWSKHRHLYGTIVPRLHGSVFLEVQVPKDLSEADGGNRGGQSEDQRRQIISIAEQLYTTLSDLGRGAEYLSFEIAAVNKKISFYINCSSAVRGLVEKQVHAQYPYAHVEEVKPYNPFSKGSVQSTVELITKKKYVYPFRTYKEMESDPLNAITNAMSKLGDGESAVLQLVISPAGSSWQSQPRKMAQEIQQGKSPELVDKSALGKFTDELAHSVRNKDQNQGAAHHTKDLTGSYSPINLTPMQQEVVKRLEQKASRPGFRTNTRLVTSAGTSVDADAKMRDLLSSFMQYSMPPFNSFKVRKQNDKQVLLDFIIRAFHDVGMICNTEELSSLWHLPTPSTETPNIKWLAFKKLPPPINLPKDGVSLGVSSYRGVQSEVRMSRDDRRRHMYLIGRTGTGKSNLIASMAVQDIIAGEGLCVVDPHGDLIENILERIPKERAEDVILFEPFDMERPMGLNILEVHSEEEKDTAVQEMISIFYKLVTDPAMLGPMFEHNMRNAMLTLMADNEYPGTITDIPRIFTDTQFQKYKVSKLNDHVVRAFWEKEMAKTSDFHKSEMLGYLISKVGRFTENAMIRNIVGQSKSSFNFREVMDSGKILLLNLAKGKTGEINAKLLGLMIVSKLQMAALGRADMPEEQRRDFYLYVDEFQNFITDSFATILSEARKYRLDLIIAHQYLGQLESSAGSQGAGTNSLRDAVFGNAGTEVCYRIGVEDAQVMAKEFAPTVSEYDLVNIDRYNAYLKLMIKGTASKPFNMAVPKLPDTASPERAAAIRQLSRLKYGRPRAEVEAELQESASAADRAQDLVAPPDGR